MSHSTHYRLKKVQWHIKPLRHVKMRRQRDRQTDRQTETDRQTDWQTDGLTARTAISTSCISISVLMQDKNGDINATYFDQHSVKYNNAQLAYACISITELQKCTQWQISGIIPCQPMIKTGCIFYFVSHFAALYSIAVGASQSHSHKLKSHMLQWELLGNIRCA